MSNTKTVMSQAANTLTAPLNVEDVFSTYLYEGNGSTQTITNGIDLEGEGGLAWFKTRNDDFVHALFDTERGANKFLRSNGTDAETDDDNSLMSFNSNGFSLSADGRVNALKDYASWTFRKAPKFFDVVTYTGDGNSSQTIPHNLGGEVGFIVVKKTSASGSWFGLHRNSGLIILNETGAAYSDSVTDGYFGDGTQVIRPTSTHFTIGSAGGLNDSGATLVAYLFAHNDGDGGFNGGDIIKCGSYTGNGSTDGPEIDLGFEPQWVMVKSSTQTADWTMYDSMRGAVSGTTGSKYLHPNKADAEATRGFSFFANGFQPRNTGTDSNTSGQTYIYIAIRRGTKVPESGTEVFSARAHTGSGSTQEISLDHDADVILSKGTSSSSQKWLTTARIFGQNRWTDFGTDGDLTAVDWDKNKGYYANADSGTESFSGTYWGSSYIHYIFKRAPEVVDFVVYTGTGSNQTIKHNLGVAPDFMLVSGKNDGASYHSSQGATKSFDVNATGVITSSTVWQNTTPTATEFYVGTADDVNSSTEPFGALLLANKEGLIDVGTYTGNGTSQTIDCGFSSGARFVMLREAGVAYWFIFDTAHGIVAGDDDYFLGSTTAENHDGAADLIDPVSSGFIVNKDTGVTSNTNNNLATYIYVAIA